MSPIQAPVCTPSAAAREDLTVPSWGPEFPHLNAFRDFTSLEEGNHATRKRLGSVAQFTLQTYQAAAVVSTVLSGVESQLLVFFKTSPDYTQQPTMLSLQCLLILTYVALIFSVSATISSLVLTRNSGTVSGSIRPFQKNVDGENMRGFEITPFQSTSEDGIAPRRLTWAELHWLFMLVVSVLCLPAQIFLILWMHERGATRAIVFMAGVFAMLPLLHLFPFPSRCLGDEGNPTSAPFPQGNGRVNGPRDEMLSASVSLPPPIYTLLPPRTSH